MTAYITTIFNHVILKLIWIETCALAKRLNLIVTNNMLMLETCKGGYLPRNHIEDAQVRKLNTRS